MRLRLLKIKAPTVVLHQQREPFIFALHPHADLGGCRVLHHVDQQLLHNAVESYFLVLL